MDRARYFAEISSDANSIVTDGSFEPCDLNSYSFDLAHSERDEIDRVSDNTVRSGNWAEYTLIFSQNIAACEEHREMPETAAEAITHIAFHAYREDLRAAVSAFCDEEIAEIRGWHKCPECDDWHEDEDKAAKCCGGECAWCGDDTDGSEHCSAECARQDAEDDAKYGNLDADDATDDERGLACWEDGEV
jgi:hypothetical protein